MKNFIKVGFILLFTFLFTNQTFAADLYWVASSTSNWNNTNNWSTTSGGAGGAGVPGAVDIVYFDNNGLGGCNLDLNISIAGVQILAGYTGTITQGSFSINIGVSNFTQADGAFQGGSNNITLNSSFTISGGNFISTNTGFTISGNFTHSGGNINPNNGLLTFNGGGARTYDVVSPAPVWHQVAISMGNDKTLTIQANDTLIVANQLTCNNGKLNDNFVALQGDCQINNGWDNGSSTLVFTGSSNANLNLNSDTWEGNNIIIHKDGSTQTVTVQDIDGDNAILIGANNNNLVVREGVLQFETGVTADLNYGNLNIEPGGTFSSSDTEVYFQGNYYNSGGNFTHNSGIFIFNGGGARTFTCDNSPTDVFYQVKMSMGNDKVLTITAGDTLRVSNYLELNNGKLNGGEVAVEQTCRVNSNWDNGDASLWFVGSPDSFYDLNGAVWEGNNVYVNKSTATQTTTIRDVDGDNSIQLGGNNNNLVVREGILQFETGVTANLNYGNLNIEPGGTFSSSNTEVYFQGNYNNSGGTFTHNNGTFIFDGGGARTFTCDNSPTDVFYNIRMAMGNDKVLTITTGDTLRASNLLELNNGKLIGGEVAVEQTCQVNANWDNGDATLWFVGSADSFYDFNGAVWEGNNVYVNKNNATQTATIRDIDGDNSVQLGGNNNNLVVREGILQFETGVTANLNYGNLNIEPGGTFSSSNTEVYFQGNYYNSGGTFTHNNGTFIFDGGGARTFTCDNSPTDVFYNIRMAMGNDKVLTITAGDTLRASNLLELNNGKLNGGEVAVEQTCQVNANWDNGDATLWFVGSADSFYDFNGAVWEGNNVYVNKNNATQTATIRDIDGDNSVQLGGNNNNLVVREGILQFETGVTANLNYGNLNIEPSGTFSSSDTEVYFQGNYNNSGGTFTHNNGTFIFDGGGARTFTCDNSSTDVFYNIRMAMGNDKVLTITTGDTLRASNLLELNNGKLNGGEVAVEQICQVNANWDGGDANLWFIGNLASYYDFNSGTWADNHVYVKKDATANTVTFRDIDNDGNLNVGGTSKNLTIVEGTLNFESGVNADLNFNNLIIQTGGILVGSDNEIAFQGNFQNTGGTFTHNNGSFRFNGGGARNFTTSVEERFYNFYLSMGNDKVLTNVNGLTIHTEGILSFNNGKMNGGNFKAEGNVNVADAYDGGDTPLIFTGAANQTFNLNTTPDNFTSDITLNKSTNTNVTLLSNFELIANNQDITFTRGYLVTSASTLFIMGDNRTWTGASNDSFVDGPMQKIGNDAFEFPVGDNSYYAPASISAPSATGHIFQAEYLNIDPDPTYDDDLKDITIDHISSCEYWDIQRINGASNVYVTLSWDTPRSCGVDIPYELRVAHWDGAKWEDLDNGAYAGNTTSGTIRTLNPVSNFSPFTLASVSMNNPLPVELLSFAARQQVQNIVLTWTTAKVTNTKVFKVEKSVDGQSWQKIGEVASKQVLEETNTYQFLDKNPTKGVNYYRLKQIGNQGQYRYSHLSTVRSSLEFIDFQIYPNPASQFILTNLVGISAKNSRIVNNQGISFPLVIEESTSPNQKQINISHLKPGMYSLSTPWGLKAFIKQ